MNKYQAAIETLIFQRGILTNYQAKHKYDYGCDYTKELKHKLERQLSEIQSAIELLEKEGE